VVHHQLRPALEQLEQAHRAVRSFERVRLVHANCDLLDRDGGETSLVEQVERRLLDRAHGVEPPGFP
jgi:hypothetical protein